MKFVIYEDHAGEFRWRLKASNGRIIADGGEGYHSRSNCRRAVLRLQHDFSLHRAKVVYK